MFVSVIHRISDPGRFGEMMRNASIPDGLRVHQVASNEERSTMVCLWETPSLESIHDFLEPSTAGFCENEYVLVDNEKSMGLPESTLT